MKSLLKTLALFALAFSGLLAGLFAGEDSKPIGAGWRVTHVKGR